MSSKNKVLVLGIDGMDPMITKKYLEKGVMPNLQKIVERGAQREDLVMLGSVPTVTPPMWTTLATGALPATHGITDFWAPRSRKFGSICICTKFRNVQGRAFMECYS